MIDHTFVLFALVAQLKKLLNSLKVFVSARFSSFAYIKMLFVVFQPIPLAPAQGSLPQMELPDSALTYLPWAQPITTISAMPSSGVQFSSGSSALPGSPLVHMPLSMSLTTMFPQLEAQGLHPPQPQILEMPQRSEHQLDPEPQDDEGSGAESESPSLLDKLLEEQKGEGEEEDKDSYSSSIFIPNV